MQILHLSDTHNRHHQLSNLPAADVLIHSGDFSCDGTVKEVLDFIEWFGALPYKYKIFVAGNHDDCLFEAQIDGLPDGCFYLSNSSIEIENIKFHGIPMFMADLVSGECSKHFSEIPSDTNVLITHQPPFGLHDFSEGINYGDLDLLRAVLKIRPAYHLFGHIHDSYGISKNKHTKFSNASLVDMHYQLVNQPFGFEY